MDLIIVGSAFVEIIVQVGLKGHVVSRAISHTLFKPSHVVQVRPASDCE